MLDRFRAFWTKVFTPVARLLIRLGVSPDAVTLVGTLGLAAGALVFFPQGKLLTGVLVITAFVFSDLIDGTMARMTGRTYEVRGVPRLDAGPDRVTARSSSASRSTTPDRVTAGSTSCSRWSAS